MTAELDREPVKIVRDIRTRRIRVRADNRLTKREALQAAWERIKASNDAFGWKEITASFDDSPGHLVVDCYFHRSTLP